MNLARVRRVRIDSLLVDTDTFQSRTKAQEAVDAGRVFIDKKPITKSSTLVAVDSNIQVQPGKDYVSRGAYKLLAALDRFAIDVDDKVVLDAGCSTGGFTQVCLERGACKVIGVDVGYGQFAWKLRSDPRVELLERTNIRNIKSGDIQPEPNIVVADLSFISLTKVIHNLFGVLAANGEVVVLVKPQFELERSMIGKGGIVRKPEYHEVALERVIDSLPQGSIVRGLMVSPIKGAEGNIEYLLYLLNADTISTDATSSDRKSSNLVKQVVAEAWGPADK